MLVIDRHPRMPTQIREWGQGRNQRKEGKNKLVAPPIQRAFIIVPPGGNAHPEVLLDALKRRTEVPFLDPRTRSTLGVKSPVKQWRVRRVDLALYGLQPITFLNSHREMNLFWWNEIQFQLR